MKVHEPNKAQRTLNLSGGEFLVKLLKVLISEGQPLAQAPSHEPVSPVRG